MASNLDTNYQRVPMPCSTLPPVSLAALAPPDGPIDPNLKRSIKIWPTNGLVSKGSPSNPKLQRRGQSLILTTKKTLLNFPTSLSLPSFTTRSKGLDLAQDLLLLGRGLSQGQDHWRSQGPSTTFRNFRSPNRSLSNSSTTLMTTMMTLNNNSLATFNSFSRDHPLRSKVVGLLPVTLQLE